MSAPMALEELLSAQLEAKYPGWSVRPPSRPSGMWVADRENPETHTSLTVFRRTAGSLAVRLAELSDAES